MNEDNKSFDWAQPHRAQKPVKLTEQQVKLNQRLDEIKAQMREAGVFDLFGTTKEVTKLPEILQLDETVLYATSGFVDKGTVLIVVTDKRLVFINSGMFYGTDFREIPFKKINGISYSTGLMLATIAIDNGANTTIIKNVSKQSAPTLVEVIKKQIERTDNISTNKTDLPSFSVADELLKLKSLLDDGILTQDEFDLQKHRILNK